MSGRIFRGLGDLIVEFSPELTFLFHRWETWIPAVPGILVALPPSFPSSTSRAHSGDIYASHTRENTWGDAVVAIQRYPAPVSCDDLVAAQHAGSTTQSPQVVPSNLIRVNGAGVEEGVPEVGGEFIP